MDLISQVKDSYKKPLKHMLKKNEGKTFFKFLCLGCVRTEGSDIPATKHSGWKRFMKYSHNFLPHYKDNQKYDASDIFHGSNGTGGPSQ